MCVFCAAVPIAGTLGAMANSKQRKQIHLAEEQGNPPPRLKIPAGYATAGVIGVLVICSAIYHTQTKLPF